ncbi:hypothetical protein [Mucilaginibacter pocheonensis]|nr:hypothetical protein [Mucilaginibacter pocheonensis]
MTAGTYAYDANGSLSVDSYKALVIAHNTVNRTDKITIPPPRAVTLP